MPDVGHAVNYTYSHPLMSQHLDNVTEVRLERIDDGTPRVPMWFGELALGETTHRMPDGLSLEAEIDHPIWECEFRAVSIDRLGAVLETGIDVIPTDAPVYAGDLDKAWEYGDFPKVILALDRSALERTWREVPADTPDGELASIQAVYPTKFPTEDGEHLWFTRLDASDPRRINYESSYGWWIPGDPWKALRAIIVFGPAGMNSTLRQISVLAASLTDPIEPA